ncbi:helix-turn-helix domain-containing protein [Mucilaginibacter sp. BT774]|uniref:helix-turn-helix domain-containing protein n=1 Tax=Mucilaginibacter sp. BT774 TaxID=3062276 RepID=UPI0026775FE4|nr:helix-turn-helix transcriptional regulator [Mucilaginibacter sp. BT774]MDO3627590.1 helix-turn-helix transcriptional regulator [Mucilaginibacter sp. BT774]
MGSQYRDQDFIDKIRKRIIEIRKSKGIVQEDLVDRTGFNLKQIGNIERGISNTSISNIAAIAKALEVHPQELLDFDFDIPKYPPLRKDRKGK